MEKDRKVHDQIKVHTDSNLPPHNTPTVASALTVLTPDGGSTVHVLRCVFEQAVASVVIFDVVEGDGLEAPPA